MAATALALMRARLRALLELHGTTPTKVARALGRSATWLRRKLDGDLAQPRPLLVEDLDLVLHHLGVPVEVLLAPVLLPGDEAVLVFCTRQRAHAEIEDVFRHASRTVERLLSQGLLERADDMVMTTSTGLQLAARPPADGRSAA